MAHSWMIAHRTERHVAGSLAPLTAVGYTFLHDRGWPGTRSRAQIDHVLVGPGGLFIVDTKAWADVEIAGGRIFRGQEDVTDDLDALADLAYGAEAVLAEIGLAPGEVAVIVVLAGRSLSPTQVGTLTVVGESQAARHISARGNRLTARQVDAVLTVAMAHFPVLQDTPVPVDLSFAAPALPEPEAELLPEARAGDTPRVSIGDVTDVVLASLLAAPIEEWMAFMHPTQTRIVRRNFNGPSRIRGAAGTGKTVVGLHRAAYLARSQPGKVLVTSYVRTLPAVLSTLMRRLSPGIDARLEFAGVNAVASRILAQRGIGLNIDPRKSDEAFQAAWSTNGPALSRIDPDRRYWTDEISKVIKGRGLDSFEQYADLARTGRRRPLGLDQRRAVWKLFVDYESGRLARGAHDFDDQILAAESALRETPSTDYGAVIVDEAQDLTCAMVRMLHLLVGDAPDGLTLIGDGQQSIYPGGYTLAEAGISISGRAVVMTKNYRNTKQIVDFASALVYGDEVAEIDDAVSMGGEPIDIARFGPLPMSSQHASTSQHDTAMVAHIRSLGSGEIARLGDVAVLGLTTWNVRDLTSALSAAGIPHIGLDQYDGRPSDAVKIGTIKRAKGLEFKQVLLGRVPSALLSTSGPTTGDTERRSLQRRELYVAMTRARDGLWVGSCS